MPSYYFEPPPPGAYASQIAELMQRPAQYQADAVLQGAAARAYAGQLAAHARAQAGQLIGQGAGDIFQLPQALRDQEFARQRAATHAALEQEQLQTATMANREKAQAVVVRDRLGRAIADNTQLTSDGHLRYDVSGFVKLAQADPLLAPWAHEPADALQKANDSYQQWLEGRDQSKTAALRNIYAATAEAGGTPSDLVLIAQPHLRNGLLNETDLQSVYQRLAQEANPIERVRLLNALGGVKPTIHAVPEGGSLVETTPGLPAVPIATGVPKPKDEWQTFKESYPKTLGLKTWDQLAPSQQTAGLAAFTQAKQDPALAALAKESAAMRLALERVQLGQQPTADDAKTIAQQLITNKMAPSQLQLFGGFGLAGQAFKRMVLLEATKLDPTFNLEEAESTYQLAKSPAFQQTTRYMESVQASMPRLQEAANKLANGKIRSVSAVLNWTKTQLNGVDIKQFNTDRIFVGDELAKILQGGGTGSATTDAKLAQGLSILRESDDPANIAVALREANFMIGQRKRALVRGTYLERQEPGAVSEGTVRPITDPGYPAGAEQTFRDGQWIRTK